MDYLTQLKRYYQQIEALQKSIEEKGGTPDNTDEITLDFYNGKINELRASIEKQENGPAILLQYDTERANAQPVNEGVESVESG